MVSVFSYYKKIDWGKRRRGGIGEVIQQIFSGPQRPCKRAATANAHASVWMREQAAVLLRSCLLSCGSRDKQKAAVASSYYMSLGDKGTIILSNAQIFCGISTDS